MAHSCGDVSPVWSCHPPGKFSGSLLLLNWNSPISREITFYYCCIFKITSKMKRARGDMQKGFLSYVTWDYVHTQPDQSQTTASSFYSSLNFRFIKWTFSRDAAGQERRIPFTEKKKLVSTHVQKGGMGVHAHPSPLLPFQSHIWGEQ